MTLGLLKSKTGRTLIESHRGIGLAMAKLFAEEGAKIILLVRDQVKGESEARSIPSAR